MLGLWIFDSSYNTIYSLAERKQLVARSFYLYIVLLRWREGSPFSHFKLLSLGSNRAVIHYSIFMSWIIMHHSLTWSINQFIIRLVGKITYKEHVRKKLPNYLQVLSTKAGQCTDWNSLQLSYLLFSLSESRPSLSYPVYPVRALLYNSIRSKFIKCVHNFPPGTDENGKSIGVSNSLLMPKKLSQSADPWLC